MALSSKFNYTSMITNSTEIKEEKIYCIDPKDSAITTINNNNNKITIETEKFDSLSLLYQAELIFSVKFYKSQAKPNNVIIEDALADNICPINNFIYHLFDSITLSLNTVEIESLKDLYYPLSMMKLLTRSKEYVETEGIYDSNILDSEFDNTNVIANNPGWRKRNYRYISGPHVKTRSAGDRRAQVVIKLEDLFGFCYHYRKALYNCKVKIDFVRKISDDANKFMFYNFGTDAEREFGYIELGAIQLRIPQEVLESKYQAEYESQFLGDKEITILYNRRWTDWPPIPDLTGCQKITVRTINNPPEFILLAIIDEASVSSYSSNNGLFVSTVGGVKSDFLSGIEEVSLSFGNVQTYPSNPLKLYDQFNYMDQLYKEYCKLSHRFGHAPQLSAFEFTHNYPFICFDLQKHKQHIFSDGATIKLNFMMTSNNTKKYRCYIMYVENCMLKGRLGAQGFIDLKAVSFNTIN